MNYQHERDILNITTDIIKTQRALVNNMETIERLGVKLHYLTGEPNDYENMSGLAKEPVKPETYTVGMRDFCSEDCYLADKGGYAVTDNSAIKVHSDINFRIWTGTEEQAISLVKTVRETLIDEGHYDMAGTVHIEKVDKKLWN